jgi:hypothetical protein
MKKHRLRTHQSRNIDDKIKLYIVIQPTKNSIAHLKKKKKIKMILFDPYFEDSLCHILDIDFGFWLN